MKINTLVGICHGCHVPSFSPALSACCDGQKPDNRYLLSALAFPRLRALELNSETWEEMGRMGQGLNRTPHPVRMGLLLLLSYFQFWSMFCPIWHWLKLRGIPVGLGYNIPLVLPWVVSMQPTNSPGSLFTLSFMTESDSWVVHMRWGFCHQNLLL